MRESFEHIQTGDQVALTVDYGRGMVLHKVTKTTPTTFSTAHYVFYKKDGRQRGGGGYSSPRYALLVTPERKEKAEEYMLRRWAKDFAFVGLPADALRQIKQIALAAKPQESK